jgi:MoxR-like ATPase
MAIVEETRRHPAISVGVSTRGALAWYRAAQAVALLDGRGYVIPDDVKGTALPALAHRVILAAAHESIGRARSDAERTISDVLARIPVPV